MRIASLVLALVLGPVAIASAGVIVVDPANGPGTDFTSLAAAIQAAASGDVLLLRTGTYDGSFVVTDKTLSMFADVGADVHLTTGTLVGSTAPALEIGGNIAGPSIVRGLTLSSLVGGGVPLIAGSSVPSSNIYIEDCSVPLSGDAGMRLGGVGRTTLSRCSANGADGDPGPGANGLPLLGRPAVIASGGPLAIFSGTLWGGQGLVAGLYGPQQVPTPGQDGAPGVQVENTNATVKLLSRALCIGGTGGDGAAPGGNCLPPGDGGDGVLTVVGGNVHVAGLLGLGDLPGAGAPGCGQSGTPGDLLASVPPAAVATWLPGNPVTVTVTPVGREDELVTVSVTEASSQSVGLLVGFVPQSIYLPNYSGVLVVLPSLVIRLGLVTSPFGTSFQMLVPELGPGVESLIAIIQPVSMDPQGHQALGVPSALLMVDRQF